MKIDLHVHTSTGSDGALPVDGVLREAKKRGIGFLSITDHDSVAAQERAAALAKEHGIRYVTGIELNVTFQPGQGKALSLDFLGYGFDYRNAALDDKLKTMRQHRDWRAQEIMKRVNAEFGREGIRPLTDEDMQNIRSSVDGAFGRPHIANYLVKKGVVGTVQEAFDRYLVKCDVPKYPLSLEEASGLIHEAGGVLVIAHPADSNGTSLYAVSSKPEEQIEVIEDNMLGLIDGVECWHQRHDGQTAATYEAFARKHRLICTGGSDCHQKPIVMGTVYVPESVAGQFQKAA
jgi:hypothetical protein